VDQKIHVVQGNYKKDSGRKITEADDSLVTLGQKQRIVIGKKRGGSKHPRGLKVGGSLLTKKINTPLCIKSWGCTDCHGGKVYEIQFGTRERKKEKS